MSAPKLFFSESAARAKGRKRDRVIEEKSKQLIRQLEAAGYSDCEEIFFNRFGTEEAPIEAEICAHDYAHEKCYFRIVRTSIRVWRVFVKQGRRNKMRCCRHKRSYVHEEAKILWQPRGEVKSKKPRKRTNKTVEPVYASER